MKKYLILHKIFIKQYIKQILEYKADFIIGLSGVLISQYFTLVFLSIIFSKIPKLVGWSFYEIMFIYGFSLLPKGIDHLLFDNLWALGQRLIRKGEFDKYLLRPISPLFHVMVETFQVDALGEIIFALILLFYTLPYMDWTFPRIMILIMSIFFATLIYTSIKVIAASISFWSKQSGGLLYIFYMFNDFAKYPVTIYNSTIRWVISYILPFAFTAFYPASYFLTKKNFLYNIGGLIFISILFSLLSIRIWDKGINNYESAGS
ncbi:TPA: ABC-2 family transporter protein [Streptococcus pyogenes]|uniref:ABC transporter permease n=1 Tax=Streptococcus pyogenes TaxID=1314 RepID=UPI00109BDF1E|nr:ABC-2 family transporter protein [Streptococcus pyogenes]QCK61520.1 multidrug ABC transporter permease [Streptococcus pyogenes]VGQ64127.1 ABC transporter permeae [Streptococcus pyogenes]VGQ66656.1 ABC transporter permeae [Streptococcus pyogenes]VGT48775.1 ABC transporter permeae [Streptococcus pyogenes]VGU74183.1 ABC transporter permeae [Streptococcus pyogenes]